MMDINLLVIKNQEFIAKKLELVCRGVLSFVPGMANTLILHYLGALFDRLKGMLNYQKTLFDVQNRPLGTMAFDGDKYLFSTRFNTQKGRFLVFTENSSKAKESGVFSNPGIGK